MDKWKPVPELTDYQTGWIGVDLDGTLAEYDSWKGVEHIGPPIEKMVKLVQQLIADGHRVKIFTARVCQDGTDEGRSARRTIELWVLKHIDYDLEITNIKDYGMKVLYDDRAITVEKNTGKILTVF